MMKWWQSNQLRMIQNNIRDIDVSMNIDLYVQRLEEFGANTCMVNCGGISSFFPSDLPSQTPSPYLKGDFYGELVEKCHAKGIRVIARFDFSKTHEHLLSEHPDWYARSLKGEIIRYHDTVATCVNGEYQQHESIRILQEALKKYELDGVFFNMFGYQTRDYSGNYVGICQCENCKKRFSEQTGMILPTEENIENPVFRRYQQFKKDTVKEQIGKICEEVRKINPQTAVCTYCLPNVDMIRNESNSAVDRPYPFLYFNSEHNVSAVRGSFSDTLASNCVINAVDIFYRFMGVSKELNQLRLWGNMAAGSGLDWCIIGGFEDYPDYDNFETVKEVFHFHKCHEKYFGHFKSLAKILLLTPSTFGTDPEYLGIFKMLKESHQLFDVMDVERDAWIASKIDQYSLVIIPGITSLPVSILNALSKTNASILATGGALQENPDALKEVFDITIEKKEDSVRGDYLLKEPKTIFKRSPLQSWIYVDNDFYRIAPGQHASTFMPLIKTARYGPPERCFGHTITDTPALSVSKEKNAYLPWFAGTLYHKQGFTAFKDAILDICDHIYSSDPIVQIEGHEQIEMFFDTYHSPSENISSNTYLLQFMNYSGFNGATFFPAIPAKNIRVRFNGITPVKITQLLNNREKILDLKPDENGYYVFSCEKNYDAYVIEV